MALSIDINAPDTWLLENIIATDLVTGEPVDINGDTVNVALVAQGTYPGDDDWVTCSWSALPNAVTILFNQGPGSFILPNLGPGYYWPWVQVFDDPDQPIIPSAVPLQVRASQ